MRDGKLTEAQSRETRDLGKHAADRALRAYDDAALLVSDHRQRAGIALYVLSTVVGMALAEIDKAERRPVKPGTYSPEAFALVMKVFAGLDPSEGRSALVQERDDA